jgi:hypothetical protein
MLAEVDAEIEYRVPDRPDPPFNRAEEEDSRRGEAIINEIALNMWTNYER